MQKQDPSSFPTWNRNEVPKLSTDEMIEVDRAMMEDYRIELIQMMENAGRALALTARALFLNGDATNRRVQVLAGRGGNGGGALVAARRLAGWGAKVEVFTSKPTEDGSYQGVPGHQLDILKRMGVKLNPDKTAKADVILDGLIGYSLKGAPRGRAAELIESAMQAQSEQQTPILSLDAPSGLDTSSGQAFDPGIEATATLTLALPKQGLDHHRTGRLFLADISVPPELYPRFLKRDVPDLFKKSDVVELV